MPKQSKIHGNSKVAKFAKKASNEAMVKSSKFHAAMTECSTKLVPNHDGKRPKMTGNGYQK
jgi:hypothetical protein